MKMGLLPKYPNDQKPSKKLCKTLEKHKIEYEIVTEPEAESEVELCLTFKTLSR